MYFYRILDQLSHGAHLTLLKCHHQEIRGMKRNIFIYVSIHYHLFDGYMYYRKTSSKPSSEILLKKKKIIHLFESNPVKRLIVVYLKQNVALTYNICQR